MNRIKVGQTVLALVFVGGLHAQGLAGELNQGSGPAATNKQSAMGINLADPQSYQPDYLFVDAALKGRKWIAHDCSGSTWDTGKPMTTDAKGWVIGVPADVCPGMVLLDAPDTPLGTYVVIWEGEGTLAAQLGPAAGLKCKSSQCQQTGDNGLQVRSSGRGPHKATFDLKTAETTITDLRIIKFNTKLPIKNISVIVPGGVPGTSVAKLDYKVWCKTARGPTGTREQSRVGKPPQGQSCFDFADVYWNRFHDALSAIQNPKVLLHPVTLTDLEPYRFIRAMDWMRTNESEIKTWSQRTHYQQQNQTESDSGVALEYLVALINALGSDVWVNVPHRADNEYVSSLARFLRDNVHRGLRTYVEYSNELWNDAFGQARWLQTLGVSRNLSSDPWEARLRCQSERAVEIADMFRAEFTGQTSRLVNVLAGQAANPDTGRVMLEWKGAKNHFDAYAIAPYFGGSYGTNSEVASFSSNRLFEELDTKALTEVRGWVQGNRAMLAKLGASNLRLVTYEAGPHLVGVSGLQDNEAMTTLFIGANRDTRMYKLLLDYLRMLKAEGVTDIGYFNHMTVAGKFGAWGAREKETDEKAPKLLALNSFMRANQCWWRDCARTETGGSIVSSNSNTVPPPAADYSSKPASATANRSVSLSRIKQRPTDVAARKRRTRSR